jgi:serine/threonine-protein kinase
MRLGRYGVRRTIGWGRSSEILLADEACADGSRRRVVLKTRIAVEPAVLRACHHELAVGQQMHHPNIAAPFEEGRVGAIHFLVMDHVAGLSLRQLLAQRGPLPIAAAIRIVRSIADALSYLHERSLTTTENAPLVHRDVCPENVLLGSSGAIKLIDFEHSAPEGAAGDDCPLDQIQPAYAAPEVLATGVVDRRSDLWSLGVLLYEAVTGALPFEPTSPEQLLEAQLSNRWVPVEERRPDAEELAPVLAYALDPNLSSRFQSASELGAALVGLDADGEESLAELVGRTPSTSRAKSRASAKPSTPPIAPALPLDAAPSASVEAAHLEEAPAAPSVESSGAEESPRLKVAPDHGVLEPKEAPPLSGMPPAHDDEPLPTIGRWSSRSKVAWVAAAAVAASIAIVSFRGVLGLDFATGPGASAHRAFAADTTSARDARLSISATPRVSVVVDDVQAGEGSALVLQLVPGVHRLMLKPLDSKGGLRAMSVPVDLAARTETHLRVDLRTGRVSQLSMDLDSEDQSAAR